MSALLHMHLYEKQRLNYLLTTPTCTLPQTEESRLHAWMHKGQRRLSQELTPPSPPTPFTPSTPPSPRNRPPFEERGTPPLMQHQHRPRYQQQQLPLSPSLLSNSPLLSPSPSPRQLSPLTAPPPSVVEKAFGGVLGSSINCQGCGYTLVRGTLLCAQSLSAGIGALLSILPDTACVKHSKANPAPH